MGNIFKKEMHLQGKKDAIKVKSYLESLKYQKGIRVLHDFHIGTITSLYEVSVKSITQSPSKRMISISTLLFLIDSSFEIKITLYIWIVLKEDIHTK